MALCEKGTSPYHTSAVSSLITTYDFRHIQFKHAVETMHPIYTSVYAKKKQAFHDVGGDTELLGLSGRDLTTGLSKYKFTTGRPV